MQSTTSRACSTVLPSASAAVAAAAAPSEAEGRAVLVDRDAAHGRPLEHEAARLLEASAHAAQQLRGRDAHVEHAPQLELPLRRGAKAAGHRPKAERRDRHELGRVEHSGADERPQLLLGRVPVLRAASLANESKLKPRFGECSARPSVRQREGSA